MRHYNVWENGVKINAHPLNKTTADHMVWLLKFNYKRTAKAIPATWKKL